MCVSVDKNADIKIIKMSQRTEESDKKRHAEVYREAVENGQYYVTAA